MSINKEIFTKYLEDSEFINWKEPIIYDKALSLAEGYSSEEEIAKACFEFVRNKIKHSLDYNLGPVTCKASDVLIHGTGFCYAKSHLLAALLRANSIPAGLCYQRMLLSDSIKYCLHGLNAVYLDNYGWYRIDPRGNKPGISAEFCPPVERLAFVLTGRGEKDFSGIRSEPCREVINALCNYNTVEQVYNNLPDLEELEI
jgi:transglutaminase-like putative cysteine protease